MSAGLNPNKEMEKLPRDEVVCGGPVPRKLEGCIFHAQFY